MSFTQCCHPIVPLSSSIFINRGVNPLMAFLSALRKKKKEKRRGKKKKPNPVLLNPPVDNACLHRRPCVYSKKAGPVAYLAPSVCWLNGRSLTLRDLPFPPRRVCLCSSPRFSAGSWMRPLTFALVAQEGLAMWGTGWEKWSRDVWSFLGFPIQNHSDFLLSFHWGSSS